MAKERPKSDKYEKRSSQHDEDGNLGKRLIEGTEDGRQKTIRDNEKHAYYPTSAIERPKKEK